MANVYIESDILCINKCYFALLCRKIIDFNKIYSETNIYNFLIIFVVFGGRDLTDHLFAFSYEADLRVSETKNYCISNQL